MSNPFKAVGKVFKKITKSTIGKIVLGALAIGAVVLTAGAAIPAIGGALGMGAGGIAGALGVSGTLGTILSGAVSMGAVGAVGGLLTGGLEGMAGGFLMGAAGGGLLGAVAPGLMGTAGIFGNGFGGAAAATPTIGNVGGGLATVGQAATGATATGASLSAAGAGLGATSAAAGGAATAGTAGIAGGGGLLSNPNLLMMGGQMLSGFAGGKAKEAEIEALAEMQQDKYDRIAFNYGYKNVYGDPKSSTPTDMERWYHGYQEPMQQPDFLTAYNAQRGGLLGGAAYESGLLPTTYEIINGQVVPVQRGA